MEKIPHCDLDASDRAFLTEIKRALLEKLPLHASLDGIKITHRKVVSKGFYVSEVPFVILDIKGICEDEDEDEDEDEPIDVRYEFWFDADNNITGYDRIL